MKKYLFLVLSAIIFFSCQNNEITSDKTDSKISEYPLIDINNYDSLISGYGNKIIAIEGTCVHICKHGGRKMHIVGDNSNTKIVIMASDESGKFNPDMEGYKYRIIAKVIETRTDSEDLAEQEADILADEQELINSDDELANADAAMRIEMELANIDELRKEIVENGKGYISYYSLECISFDEIE